MTEAVSSAKCPFCAIVAGTAPAVQLVDHGAAVSFVPLGPVTPGHLLVVPRRHVEDAAEDPATTAATFGVAAELAAAAGRDCNLITSKGKAATQTVRHLHVHLVPREDGDGLALPWTGQHRSERGCSA